MTDSAFKAAPYSGYTTSELLASIERSKGGAVRGITEDTRFAMADEVTRRAKVAAGDWSVMTPGERLRAVRDAETK